MSKNMERVSVNPTGVHSDDLDDRLKIFKVSERDLVYMFTGRLKVRETLPPDAVVIGAPDIDPYTRCLVFRVRSREFEPVAKNEDIPEAVLHLLARKINDP